MEQHDVYEQLLEANEKVEESNRLKISILQNMNHEVRTPLTSILGFAELLEDEEDADKEYASRIHAGSRRLMNTVTSIMDLAQLEGGLFKLEVDRFDLEYIVRQSFDKIRPMAHQKGLDLMYESTNSEPLLVPTDARAMESILGNVLRNACQYTDAGYIRVVMARHGDRAVIEVEDTGTGMSASFLPQAFDAFKQETYGFGRTHEGVGLGLTITRHLVQLMDGQIKVVSRQGKGTTVKISIPVVARKQLRGRDARRAGNGSGDSRT